MSDTYEFSFVSGPYQSEKYPGFVRILADTEDEARNLADLYLDRRRSDHRIIGVSKNPLGSHCRDRFHPATAHCQLCGWMSDWYRRYGI